MKLVRSEEGPITGKDGHRDTEEWVALRFAPRGLKRLYLPLHARTTRSVQESEEEGDEARRATTGVTYRSEYDLLTLSGPINPC